MDYEEIKSRAESLHDRRLDELAGEDETEEIETGDEDYESESYL